MLNIFGTFIIFWGVKMYMKKKRLKKKGFKYPH